MAKELSISSAGLALIKRYEGCRLTAYQDSVGIWTIGYGHTAGVKVGQVITQAQADAFLKSDCATAEKAVNGYASIYNWNQNQFDALVSFTFNCGAANLRLLLKNGTRTIAQISSMITVYNKAGGKVLQGLVNRRAAEKTLFDKAVSGGTGSVSTISSAKAEAAKSFDKSLAGKYRVTASALNMRKGAGKDKVSLKLIPKGKTVQCYGYYTELIGVKWLYVVYDGAVGFCSSEYLVKA